MKFLLMLVVVVLVCAQTAGAKKVPPVQIGMPISVPSKPVEVSPLIAEGGVPFCAIDENGNCLGDTSEVWDGDDDGTDGTLGYYDYSAKHCFFVTPAVEWAFWPIQGRITQETFWCSMYYSYMSYRSTHVRLGSSLCGKSNAAGNRIGGWIGNFYIDVRSSGTFTCPMKWIWMNFDEWFDFRYNAGGGGEYLRES